MAAIESAARPILPRPAAPRRKSARRVAAAVPAAARGTAPRRRPALIPEGPALSGERIDSLILQGLICLAMAGMAAWFHAPLAQALRAAF
jgi:hypothetical protein